MESPERRAQMRAWYAANRERHKARQRAIYASRPAVERERARRYRRTAAGMLTAVRHYAKARGR